MYPKETFDSGIVMGSGAPENRTDSSSVETASIDPSATTPVSLSDVIGEYASNYNLERFEYQLCNSDKPSSFVIVGKRPPLEVFEMFDEMLAKIECSHSESCDGREIETPRTVDRGQSHE